MSPTRHNLTRRSLLGAGAAAPLALVAEGATASAARFGVSLSNPSSCSSGPRRGRKALRQAQGERASKDRDRARWTRTLASPTGARRRGSRRSRRRSGRFRPSGGNGRRWSHWRRNSAGSIRSASPRSAASSASPRRTSPPLPSSWSSPSPTSPGSSPAANPASKPPPPTPGGSAGAPDPSCAILPKPDSALPAGAVARRRRPTRRHAGPTRQVGAKNRAPHFSGPTRFFCYVSSTRRVEHEETRCRNGGPPGQPGCARDEALPVTGPPLRTGAGGAATAGAPGARNGRLSAPARRRWA